mmetsp:Transcript_3142/g.7971  ORF Transcript_3142/g.7971 Transcript_3142/m.7971 type:complete len:340 (-) Transcript_3142:11-1030(-)
MSSRAFTHLEGDCVEHGAEALDDVVGHNPVDVLLEVLLGVKLPHLVDLKLLGSLLILLLHRLIVRLGQFEHLLDGLHVLLVVLLEVSSLETVRPVLLVKVHKHLLLELALAVRNRDGIVVPVQPVDQSLYGGLVEVPDDRCGLPGLLPQHDHLRVDAAKSVDHHLPLHALDRIHHHRHGTLVERLKTLLRVDVHPRKPAPEPGMGVVPPDHHLRPARLLEHVEHLGLKHGIHRLDAHPRPALGHREHVANAHRVVIDKLAQHQPHNLHRHPRPAVLEHLEQRQRRDVYLLRRIHGGCIHVLPPALRVHVREHPLQPVHPPQARLRQDPHQQKKESAFPA